MFVAWSYYIIWIKLKLVVKFSTTVSCLPFVFAKLVVFYLVKFFFFLGEVTAFSSFSQTN